MIVVAKIHLVSPEDCYPFDPPGRQSLDGRILDRFSATTTCTTATTSNGTSSVPNSLVFRRRRSFGLAITLLGTAFDFDLVVLADLGVCVALVTALDLIWWISGHAVALPVPLLLRFTPVLALAGKLAVPRRVRCNILIRRHVVAIVVVVVVLYSFRRPMIGRGECVSSRMIELDRAEELAAMEKGFWILVRVRSVATHEVVIRRRRRTRSK
jgi:hypothetical protein